MVHWLVRLANEDIRQNQLRHLFNLVYSMRWRDWFFKSGRESNHIIIKTFKMRSERISRHKRPFGPGLSDQWGIWILVTVKSHQVTSAYCDYCPWYQLILLWLKLFFLHPTMTDLQPLVLAYFKVCVLQCRQRPERCWDFFRSHPIISLSHGYAKHLTLYLCHNWKFWAQLLRQLRLIIHLQEPLKFCRKLAKLR